MKRWCCTDRKCKWYVKCNESPGIFGGGGGDVMYNHDADSEACLIRQILNNSVKRKAIEDLCERPPKLIHNDLRSQYMDTVTYKDIRYISRNMQTARFSQLLPLLTDIEETHEAFSAVQVWTFWQNLFVNDSEKAIVMFSCKNNLQFFSSIDGLYVDGTFKSTPKFFHQIFTIQGLAMCNLHFSYRPKNFQRPMRIYSDIRYQRLQNLVWMFSSSCVCWLRNRHSQRSDNSVARLGS